MKGTKKTGRKNDEMREEEEGEGRNDERTSCQRIRLKRVRSKTVERSSTDIERMAVKGVVGQGSCRLGERREKGTIKISAIQSLAGNSRAWHLYY